MLETSRKFFPVHVFEVKQYQYLELILGIMPKKLFITTTSYCINGIVSVFIFGSEHVSSNVRCVLAFSSSSDAIYGMQVRYHTVQS